MFVALCVVIVVSDSVGFYEIGFSQGESAGYQNGFSHGFHSVLISNYTDIDLLPNETLPITTLPFSPNYVILTYSFVISAPSSQNDTVNMCLFRVGSHTLFSTGYRSIDCGSVNLSTHNICRLTIAFKANPNAGELIVLTFNSPLWITVN